MLSKVIRFIVLHHVVIVRFNNIVMQIGLVCYRNSLHQSKDWKSNILNMFGRKRN